MPVRKPAAEPRDRILAAALVEFARLGFDGASTRSIAARAGVNQGLITYYFGGKDPLWRAAVTGVFSRLAEDTRRRLAELAEVDPVMRLRLVLRHFVRFAAEHPEVHRLMLQEGDGIGPRTRWLHTTYVGPMFALITKLVGGARKAIPDAPMARLPPHHAFAILVGAAPHPFAAASETQFLTGANPFAKAAVESWTASIERLMLGGVA